MTFELIIVGGLVLYVVLGIVIVKMCFPKTRWE